MWVGKRPIVMQEVLSKPGSNKLPLVEQIYYELCIEESADIWRPGFIVAQIPYRWSEIDHNFMTEDPEWERWPTLKKAQEKYEERLRALKVQGYTESDMEML